MTHDQPEAFFLPAEPPLGSVVRINSHGESVYFRNVGEQGSRWYELRRLDLPFEATCWAAGSSPDDIGSIPAWTWGSILDRGPVTLVREALADLHADRRKD